MKKILRLSLSKILVVCLFIGMLCCEVSLQSDSVMASEPLGKSGNIYSSMDEFWTSRLPNLENTRQIDLSLIFTWKHFDLFVRCLYIKAYVEGVEYDKYKALYEKMQIKRVGKCSVDDFNDLIESFKRNGYINRFPIPVTKRMELLNGSHRLACCLYFKINPYIEIVDTVAHDYPLSWFRENGFSDEEISECIDLGIGLYKQLASQKNIFIGILWNVSQGFYDQIFSQLSSSNNIILIQKYRFGDKYNEFVKDVYAFDGISGWKVDKKLQFMCENPCRDVVIFFLDIPSAIYKFDEKKQKAVCSQVETLKEQIRGAYKEKVIPYVFDIILHMTDDITESYYLNQSLRKYVQYCIIDCRQACSCAKLQWYGFIPEKIDKQRKYDTCESLILCFNEMAKKID